MRTMSLFQAYVQIHVLAAITYIIRYIRPFNLLKHGKSVEAFKSLYVVVVNVLNGNF